MDDEVFRELAIEATTRHLEHAHLVILRQREQLRALNDVVKRRRFTIRRMRMFLNAVKMLHRPVVIESEHPEEQDYAICAECCCDNGGNQTEVCAEKHQGDCWPCRTTHAVGTVIREHLTVTGMQVKTETQMTVKERASAE